MLSNFGKMVVNTGVNIQKGQTVVISCPIECAEYARDCARAAYEAGAAECVMRWNDDMSARLRVEYADMKALETVPEWVVESRMYYARSGAAFISIYAEDPDAFKGVNTERLRVSSTAASRAMAEYSDYISQNRCSWCVVSAPTKAWASKVYPDLSEDEAFDKLENAIGMIMRLDTDNPIEALRENNRLLVTRAEDMTAKKIRKLRYRNSAGTDFTVELPDGHIWLGGCENTQGGVEFAANIPSEEIFTVPDFRTAEGTLVASMPLSHNGQLIRDFRLHFTKGVLTDYEAAEGKEMLGTIFSVDKGASRLGEVALVSKQSPIARQGVLFYNTLFDENASCHFAFGSAYPSCVSGGLSMSKEELEAVGVNDSMEHVDFMVGTDDLEITGFCNNGTEIAVFRDGDFVR